jgi:two-component system, LytTR family, sensor kinase
MPQRRSWPRRLAMLGGLLGICVAIGVLAAAETYYTDRALGEAVTWNSTLVLQVVHWTLWGLLLPVIVRVTERLGRARDIRVQVALQCAVGVFTSVVHSAAAFGIRSAVMPRTIHGSLSIFVRGWFLFNLVTYAALVAGTLAVEQWRRSRAHELRASRLDVELSRAQLRALQMQLHPHFLFNTLNTVAMLIRTSDGNRALTMIARLGDLLRQILDDDAPHEIPLRDELAFLDHYLGIERVRFHDRLRVEIDVDPATLDGHVPRFVLQPLVENAIRHGIEKRSAYGTLMIASRRVDGMLSIVIRDDGPGLGAGPIMGVGVGNTQERLRHLYGNAADLSLSAAAGGGTIATVVLPWHTQPVTDREPRQEP